MNFAMVALENRRARADADQDTDWLTKTQEDTAEKELIVLNRTIRWGSNGIVYRHDARHINTLVEKLGLGDAKIVQTPATVDNENNYCPEPGLKWSEAREYRSDTARCNYIAADRPDLCFITNELCQNMAAPTSEAQRKLKRSVRYLKGERSWEQVFPFGAQTAKVTAFSDSDWAGDRKTRKSTSAGCIMWNGAEVLYQATESDRKIERRG